MAKGTPATLALERARIAFALHEYDYDPDAPRIGMQAAESLCFPPARVFKTLMAEVAMAKGAEVVCALLPSDREMSTKKLARAAGAKSAAMLKPEAAERHSGYHVGGISPLGQRKRARVFLDASITGHSSVLVNGGRRGLQIEITPEALRGALGATVLDISA